MFIFEWLFAGVWAEVWKFGLGIGLIILCLAGAYFSPLGKKDFLWAAVVVAVSLVLYSRGVLDQSARCAAQAAVVDRNVTVTVTNAGKNLKKWKDPYDRPNY